MPQMKNVSGTNNLAYFDAIILKEKKHFITLTKCAKVIRLCSLLPLQKKLECLS